MERIGGRREVKQKLEREMRVGGKRVLQMVSTGLKGHK